MGIEFQGCLALSREALSLELEGLSALVDKCGEKSAMLGVAFQVWHRYHNFVFFYSCNPIPPPPLLNLFLGIEMYPYSSRHIKIISIKR